MRRLLAILVLVPGLPAVSAETLKFDGEVYAQRTASLMPPSIDRLWNFNITQLAPDGAPVKRGDVVLAFDGSEVVRQLMEKQSLLKEKQTQLAKLLLELAERERSERLGTALARSEREKAQRKTVLPAGLIAGIAYQKLLVTRQQMERKLALAERREHLSGEQRRQERRLLASEVAQLQADVQRLQQSIAALTVTAPRDGVMMHKSSWGGDKYDVGSQVWRGQTVAQIPDGATLAVRAELPERDLQRVVVGAPVRVVIEGGAGSVFQGKVRSIGRAVRSKSQVQPIPVLDLEIALDDPGARLKPAQAVRVELTVADKATVLRKRRP